MNNNREGEKKEVEEQKRTITTVNHKLVTWLTCVQPIMQKDRRGIMADVPSRETQPIQPTIKEVFHTNREGKERKYKQEPNCGYVL